MTKAEIRTECTPFAWYAMFDGYEPPDPDGVGGGLLGRGDTEQEAIDDLIEQGWEEEAVAAARAKVVAA